ncbi:hypothetical protein [Actinopolyspora saharensis]|uniref:hypothetical protein n=1 Tax=Actinopolyspora saharensis TaxID=995062 RepID=UPI003F67553E
MSADFDSLNNRGEYFSAHYFAEGLGPDLGKHLLDRWGVQETDELDERTTPRQRVRELRGKYMAEDVRGRFARRDRLDSAEPEISPTYGNAEWTDQLRSWHQKVLAALGFIPVNPAERSGPVDVLVHRAGLEHTVRAAYHDNGIVALECGWAAETDAALNQYGAARLLDPLHVNAGESYETGPALTSWLFHSALDKPDGNPPRFVLLLVGGVILLADRNTWGEGRYLVANLDTALERNDRKQHGELATIAGLFSLDVLRPGDNDAAPLIDTLLKRSRDNAVGVSGELRHGLQRSVEIIANEVLARLDEAGVASSQVEHPRIGFAEELTREALRYLYRILFLLYAEARPELGILPADDGSYEAGYSMARLRELVARDEHLTEEAAQKGFHLYESLDVLFALVNRGHRPYGSESDDERPEDDESVRERKARNRSEDRGLRFEALRSELFEPQSIRLIGRELSWPGFDEDEGVRLDLRLRNAALHEVLRLLTMKKATRRGERGGFISYRNLGINQLGAVYEGLMSYTGFIAEEELCEIAKGGKVSGGSWLIPASKQDQYPDEVFVHYDEQDARKGLRGRKKYPRGSFVYRLAGRERETSASYYTPESLTRVTVELTLQQRLDQQRDSAGETIRTRASELLRYRICEPALGSGSFLNEAINQVAEEYLRRRQEELGQSVPTGQVLTEKQKVKAYIALHNCYGVDLNATGVELAEVSMWLNTMHPGMRAPWFGLHLRRGNSLIGARRAVYSAEEVVSKDKAWLKSKNTLAPCELPFLRNGQHHELPPGAVHQFLLPTPGWAAVVDEKEAKNLAPAGVARLRAWRKGICRVPRTKTKQGERSSQLARVQAVARRAEYLWHLVVQRMELSERDISRRIDVWGADPGDPEYSFLRRPETAVDKEKVYRDLFETPDTPYWRLKTIMDVWCALWFWPPDRVGLLDGSDGAYEQQDREQFEQALEQFPLSGEDVSSADTARTGLVGEQTAAFSLGGEQVSLFAGSAEDDSLSGSAPVPGRARRASGKTKRSGPLRRAKIPLADLDDWLDFAEAVLGAEDVPEGSLLSAFDTLDELETYEDYLHVYMRMDQPWDLDARFPWLSTAQEIAKEQGFLHWELDFARVFARDGGFDLQIGNPPWVRPEWDEAAVLAEFDPWFKLEGKVSAEQKKRRRAEVLGEAGASDHLLHELTANTATSTVLSSPQTYSLLSGTQPDLYRAFMCRVWENATATGAIGLLHPDTHFSGDKEGALRETAYARLRVHGDFVNAGNRFFPSPVGRASHFGVHVYGPPKEIGFHHLSWLFSAEALRRSVAVDCPNPGSDPGVRFQGEWDERAHPKRDVWVDAGKLAEWQRLTGETEQPVRRARLLSPVSTAEDQAIGALADYPIRLATCSAQISRGFEETATKQNETIAYNTSDQEGQLVHPSSWSEVVLKGPQLGVANPLFKQPHRGSSVLGLDLTRIDADTVPDTEYVRAVSEKQFTAAQDQWIDYAVLEELRASEEATARTRAALAESQHVGQGEIDDEQVDRYLIAQSRRPYTSFYRLAWREMVAPDTERSLYSALLPPGANHVHSLRSMALPNCRSTVLNSGFWTSLPLDYLLRTRGVGHLDVSRVLSLPAPAEDHPLASALLLRTLRLNCLTNAYADLWAELYEPSWSGGQPWAIDWPGMQPLDAVSPTWTEDTPLRTERARRAALVEIDALVAVWLGIDADALVAMYEARFPVLQNYEAVTWFDARERRIAGHRNTYGHGQTKEHYQQLLEHLKEPGSVLPPEGYVPPFHKAEREEEMRAAHAVFQERLDAAAVRGEPGVDEQKGAER